MKRFFFKSRPVDGNYVGTDSPARRSAEDVYDHVNYIQTVAEPNAYEMKHTRLFCHPGNLKQKQTFDKLRLLKNYGLNLISIK